MPKAEIVEMKTPRDKALETSVKATRLGTRLYKDYTLEEKKGDQTLPTSLALDVLRMVRGFLVQAGPNVAQTAGKAKLSMSLTLEEHPKDGLVLTLQGGITLCAGLAKWPARHVENDQISIDFEVPGPSE